MSDKTPTPATSMEIAPASSTTIPVQAVAEGPDEMIQHQQSLINWCKNKVADVRGQANELEKALEIATRCKWGTRKVLARHLALAQKNVIYYTKMGQALESGYMIVPTMPCDLFAVRTDKKKPKSHYAYYSWQWGGPNMAQEPKLLPTGQGEYKDPEPVILEGSKITEKDSDGRETTRTEYWADHFRDEIPFPITMAKPQVMEATERAMALKIFDQFGVLPVERKQDPIILGQLIKPAENKFQRKVISFLIAWRVNTEDL